jgi:hypothetical protein
MSDHRDDGRLRDYALQLLNQAEVRLLGISQAALRAEFYDVMRTWFDETNCWQESIKFAIVPHVIDYPIVPSSGRILRFVGVVDGNNISLPGLMPQLGTVSFRNDFIMMQSAISGNSAIVTARVVLTVDAPFQNHGIPIFPSWVLPAWGTYILDGLVGRCMLHPDKSWSNVALGANHLGRFRDGYDRCRADTAKQNTIGAQAWAFPQTFRTRNQRGGVSTTGSTW